MKRIILLIPVVCLAAMAQTFSFRLGSTGVDYGKDVAVDAQGNTYVAAYFTGTVDFDPGPGQALRTSPGTGPGAVDIALAKYDPKGNLVWVVTMGGPGPDIPHSVTLDSAGNVYLAGYFSGTADLDPGPGVVTRTSAGGRDVFLAKFTSAGTLVWVNTLGGTQDDEAMDVAVDGEGNVTIVGVFNGSLDLDPGDGVARIENTRGIGSFIASYDSQGRFRWGRALSSLDDDPTLGGGIGFDRSGNVVVCTVFSQTAQLDGVTLTSAGQNDLLLAKFSRSGTLLWATSAGGAGMDMATPGNLAVDAAGASYITGNFEQTARFGAGAQARSITTAGGDDAYFAKYDADGNLVWCNSLGGASGDSGHKVAIDPAGFVLLTGWFRGTANLAPRGEAARNYTARSTGGANDAFTAKYRADTGAFVWAQPFGAEVTGVANITLGGGIAVDSLGQVTVTGRFAGSVTPALVSAGDSDIFVVRYASDGGLAVAGTPLVTAVANAAGGRAGIIAPDAYYSLFGSDLGTGGGSVSVYDSAGRERTGSVVFTSPAQVNFRTPPDQPLGAAVIKYSREDGAMANINATTEAADPGIFAIVFAAGTNAGQRITNDRPARTGDILSIYATGLGAAASSAIVQFGAARVAPSYAGGAPGLPGVNQVNFTVPAGAAQGSVSVALAVGEKVSNTSTMMVAFGGTLQLEGTVTVTDRAPIRIHTYNPPLGRGDDVSTHILELPTRLVIIDTQFYLPFAREVREYANRLGKPIDRVINSVTETEHWIGNEAFRDLPIHASAGVRATITNMSAAAFAGLRDRFGADVSNVKVNPAATIAEGAETIDGIRFEFQVIRDATSPEQLVIRIPSARAVFTTDLAINRGHLYVGRKNFDYWIGALNSLKAVPGYDLILPGHLPPGGVDLWDLNREYLEFARESLGQTASGTDFRTRLTARFPTYRATPLLDFTIRTLFPATAPVPQANGGSATIANLQVTALDGARRTVEFDIAWENSWRNRLNWDAAWIFAKYRLSGGTGAWRHATLSTSTEDHRAPNGTLTPSPDGKGVLLYRDTDGQGSVSWRGVRLLWNAAADVLPAGASADVQVFGIEMVYIPEGRFLAGDGASPGRFHTGGDPSTPFEVTAEAPRLANSRGGLWADGTITPLPSGVAGPAPWDDPQGALPAQFPTGFRAFYIMKYEITQGLYASFLNALAPAQAAARIPTASDLGDGSYRYTIAQTAADAYSAAAPTRSANWVFWEDGIAFSDWAGLRPMTELEFEKACRGSGQPAVAGEYAWGSTRIVAQTGFQGADGSGSELATPADANTLYNRTVLGPVRAGIQLGKATRELSGVSFYGVPDLSGNVVEMAVTAGTADGRRFTGNHGDGELSDAGFANVAFWPRAVAPGVPLSAGPETIRNGFGYRGGDFYNPELDLRVSARNVATFAGARRLFGLGFRAVRTAP